MSILSRGNSVYKPPLRVTKYAKLVGGADSDCDRVIEINGESIEDLARAACPHIIAVRTFKALAGTAKVNGQHVDVTSDPFEITPPAYIDGEVVPIVDLIKRVESLPAFIVLSAMKASGVTQVVACRNGQIEPFCPEDGETILSLPHEDEEPEEDDPDEDHDGWEKIPGRDGVEAVTAHEPGS